VQFRVKEKDTGASYSATQVVDVITQVLRAAYSTGVASPQLLEWYQKLLFDGPMFQQSIEAGFSPVSIEKSQEIALDPPRPIAFDEREWTRYKKEARERGLKYDKETDAIYESVKIRRPAQQDPTLLIPKALYGFDGLKKQLDLQAKQEHEQERLIRELDEEHSQLLQAQGVINSKVADAMAKHEANVTELMQQMHELALLTAADADAAEHDDLSQRLLAIQNELTNPTRCIGQLHDLVAQVEMRDDDPYAEESGGPTEVLPDVAVAELTRHLMEQQKGLDHMVNVLKTDLKNLGHLEQDWREQEVALANAYGYHQ